VTPPDQFKNEPHLVYNEPQMDTKKSVLIVDDEPKIGKIFGLKLKLAG
jgi:hypothetical protein